MHRFARPYAEALLSTAETTERAQQIRDQLRGFADLMESDERLRKLAVNPAVPLEAKERVLESLAEEMGLDPLARRFLRALLSRFRLHRLEEVLEGIEELLNRRLGIVVAEVEAAHSLSEEERDRLRRVLEKRLDRSVELEITVNPELLAGFKVKTGSELYDASVKGQLDRLTETLAEA
ncbi:MAG: ATP synthase F1 subunit delta [Thermoanaerobaculia bacterium]|nr:ATP synthase F1 subunit delta [Thermoanaerobaculia bacterium]